MGFWDWVRGRPAVEAAAPIPLPAQSPIITPSVTNKGFTRPRTNLQIDSLSALGGAAIVAAGLVGVEDPRALPWYLLDVMGFSPAIYLGETTIAAPLRDPALYVVGHSDPVVLAETHAWFDPLMPGVLRAMTRALAYGVAPFVLDWTVADLVAEIERSDKAPRKRTWPSHQHYMPLVHEVHPGESALEIEDDRLRWIRYHGQTYGAARAYCFVQDGSWGSWLGNGSRRRAWSAWYKRQNVERWEGRYLERSVDAPRIGRVPKGEIKVAGTDVPTSDYMAEALAALRGAGVMILPSDADLTTKLPLWDVSTLNAPLVESVWASALSRQDAQMIMAALAPPALVATASEQTGGDTRSLEMLFQETVEGFADAFAAFMGDIVATVHKINHGDKIPAPTVYARELPKAKLQRLLEVFKAAALAERKAGEGKAVTLAELVDAQALLDDLGVAARSEADAARDPAAAKAGAEQPGRPTDTVGGREERRDRSRTPEGGDGTGQAGGDGA